MALSMSRHAHTSLLQLRKTLAMLTICEQVMSSKTVRSRLCDPQDGPLNDAIRRRMSPVSRRFSGNFLTGSFSSQRAYTLVCHSCQHAQQNTLRRQRRGSPGRTIPTATEQPSAASSDRLPEFSATESAQLDWAEETPAVQPIAAVAPVEPQPTTRQILVSHHHLRSVTKSPLRALAPEI